VNEQAKKSVWASGAAYEPYVGRWSRLVAREFVEWLAIPAGSRWLDVGCGTGALTETILRNSSPAAIHDIDPSEGYLAVARERVRDPCVRFDVGDARDLAAESQQYDAVVCGLVLNFIPDLSLGIAEMALAARPGAVVGGYVWDYAGKMELMRYFWDAAVALKPQDLEQDEGRRFPICKPGPLKDLFESTGLTNVQVRSIDIPTCFRDFDDYWTPFLGGQFPAPDYAMSLREEERISLREHIRAHLPKATDGSISLIARAWAVRGYR
jgi:SAM-dependent methyltransferase